MTEREVIEMRRYCARQSRSLAEELTNYPLMRAALLVSADEQLLKAARLESRNR